MKKRLLSIITSVSLLASALSYGAYAAPSLAGVADTALEVFPVPELGTEIIEKNESMTLYADGPSLVTVADSAFELNTEFGTPELWEGAYLMAGLSGEGTEESPYLIGNADELKLMANNVNSGTNSSAYYKLTGDIDLGGTEWTPIGYVSGADSSASNYSTAFSGVFDGAGFTVSNFKITNDSTAYLGLFGYVVNGTVKDLSVDGVRINVSSSSSGRLYVSPLIGRIVSIDEKSYSAVTNCNVTSSSVTVTSNGTIYAGGIAGSVISGENTNSKILIAFNSSDCDFNLVTNAKNLISIGSGRYDFQSVSVGGISGYLAAEPNSTIDVFNCNSNGHIYSEATERINSISFTMSGGLFGDIRTAHASGRGGAISMNSCYSEGLVETVSGYRPYVIGGFAGQIYATKDLYIDNCYSSADISAFYHNAGYYYESPSGQVTNLDPSAGGFVGQIFFDYYITSYGKTITNCYASGDVVDEGHTETTPPDYSFVGGFMGYSTSGVFKNCYRLESQRLWGSDLNYSDYNNIIVLSEDDAKYLDKFNGFDMNNIWQMDPAAEYPYPTLREKAGYVNFISEGAFFATGVFGADGKISAPAGVPAKQPSVSKVYSFNYWSLSEDGEAFNFSSDTLSESTTLYAVFTSAPRPYKVSFMSEGKVFGTAQTLNYGADVMPPSGIPEKEETEKYYYEFLYWSEMADGTEFDFTDCTVVGNMTFHAVFKAVDKTAWKGEVATSFTSGFGTEALPYIITSGEEFALFAKVINEQKAGYTDAYYALGANINLGGNYWAPVGGSLETPFSGHFDGRGYTISKFMIGSNTYVGLFGYVLNGTIKNLGIKDFTIDIAPSSSVEKDAVYVGVLAGYISSKRGESNISAISITEGSINVNAKIDYVFAGNIAGYASAAVLGKTNIADSYSHTDITVENSTGYNYLGGIAGRLDTGSGSLASINHCFTTGSLHSESYHSSRAGGLVGYLYSYGSQYAPESGSVAEDSEAEKESASLAADDIDIMISNSFALTNAYSLSTEYTSYAGRITGEKNVHAGVENAYYSSNLDISIVADETSGTLNTKVESLKEKDGYKDVAPSTFTIASLLSEALGFDFENTWMTIPSEKYPVLTCMYKDKPILKFISADKSENTVNASLQVLFTEDYYTLIIGVYNERNQLIAVKREQFENTSVASEFDISFANVPGAKRISVSAVEKFSLKPLNVSISRDL